MRPGNSGSHNGETKQGSSQNGSSHGESSSIVNGSSQAGDHINGHVNGIASKTVFGVHDREEVTRILLQGLSDLGYRRAAVELARESGFELEVPSVASFREAVLAGQWDRSEILLFGSEAAELDGGVRIENGQDGSRRRKSRSARSSIDISNGQYTTKGLPLAAEADTTRLRFLLRQQKYLELLEGRNLNAALQVLRTELAPLKTNIDQLHFLSSLVMCPTANDLRTQADWDGSTGRSRHHLLSEVSASISPSVMIPEHRLATILTGLQDEQMQQCKYHNTTAQPSLYTDHECSQDDFPLVPLRQLEDHEDEVWYLEFSSDGTMLATAGRDGLVCVYDTERWRLKHEFREHHLRPSRNGNNPLPLSQGVCYLAFSPDNRFLISCSECKDFVVMDLKSGSRVALCDDFDYPVTAAAWLPGSEMFVIGSQSSKDPLSLFSLREVSDSGKIPKKVHSWRDLPRNASTHNQAQSFRITDLTVNKIGTRLAASTTDKQIKIYSLIPEEGYCKTAEFVEEECITSVNFSQDNDELLVSMNRGKVFTMDIETGEKLSSFEGAVQEHFVIRSAYGGAGENFVISGSEDSRVYIWRRSNCVLVTTLEAHSPGSVNAVAWHPSNPSVIASAGDDRKVRIWTSPRAMFEHAG